MTAMLDKERVVEFPALKEARGKLDAARGQLAGWLNAAGPDYDLSKVTDLTGDTHARVAEIGKKNAEINDLKAKVDEYLVIARAAAHADDAHTEKGAEAGRGSDADRGEPEQYASFGDAFVKSAAFTEFDVAAGASPAARLDISLKTLFQTAGGWAPETTRTGRVEEFPTRPAPHVVEFIPQTTTSQSAVVYMEETTFTNAAAETAEGGTYPEAALALEEKSSPVRKPAVYLPVTDELFEDEPRARDYVNNRLPFMLRQRLDLQALNGSGVSPNLLGTVNVSGIQTQALGGDPLPDAFYKLFTKIREDGFAEPSVVFIRPSKWQAVQLMRTADGVYIWGHPSQVGPQTIWGVPVVPTVAAPATSAVAGDYMSYAELAVRRGVDVQTSNSHGTYFIEGKLAVRADVRVALIHYRPKAFGTVTGLV